MRKLGLVGSTYFINCFVSSDDVGPVSDAFGASVRGIRAKRGNIASSAENLPFAESRR